MKKKSLLLTAVATLGLTAVIMAQNVPSYVPTNGLVGWWPFNGNANDESGNGNNGINNGATLTIDRNGNLNSAYYFSSAGCATRIDIANFNYGGPVNSFSMSFWMLRIGNGCISPRLFEFGNGSGWGVNWINGQSTMDWVANNTLQDNVWYHVVYVIQSGNINSYINGVFDSQYSLSNPGFGSNVCFGRMNHPAYDAFNGNLDDIATWNRALTQQEISDLYNGCQLSVNTQPSSQQININNNAQFIVGSSDPVATFQWQTDLGVGFQNLNSVGQYSGTTNDTLTVSNVTMSNNNQPFRCIINSGSCSDTSNVAVLTVNNNVGINEFAQDNLFSIYPNPAQTVINVKADSKLVGEQYTIIDNSGRTVLYGKILAEITSIELGNLSNGVYLFNVGNNKKQQFKILKH